MRYLWLLILAVPLLTWQTGAAEAQSGFWHSDSNRIYGQDLMTTEERLKYQRQLWSLPTQAEKDRFRDRHRQNMRERARDLGVAPPDESGRSPGEEGEGIEGNGWPADGLRRWPADRSDQSADGLRRWQPGGEEWSSAGRVRNWAGPEASGSWRAESGSGPGFGSDSDGNAGSSRRSPARTFGQAR